LITQIQSFTKSSVKNDEIKDVYIGHTTNFVQRKNAHKRSCTREIASEYNVKVYKFIREFGGWDNWKMEIIAFTECADHYSARKIEQRYFEEYNATLNTLEPLPKPKVVVNKESNIAVNNESNEGNENNINHTKKKFVCEICQFSCGKQSNYNTHISTPRHIKQHSATSCVENNTYKCSKCNLSYKDRSGLWRHKKNCKTYKNEQRIAIESAKDDLVQKLKNDFDAERSGMKLMFTVMMEKYQEMHNQNMQNQKQSMDAHYEMEIKFNNLYNMVSSGELSNKSQKDTI